MSQDAPDFESLLDDSRIRTLIGLVGGTAIAVTSILFLSGLWQWVGLGLAVVDVLFTPYLLGVAARTEHLSNRGGASGQ
jgi:hypothetical protein